MAGTLLSIKVAQAPRFCMFCARFRARYGVGVCRSCSPICINQCFHVFSTYAADLPREFKRFAGGQCFGNAGDCGHGRGSPQQNLDFQIFERGEGRKSAENLKPGVLRAVPTSTWKSCKSYSRQPRFIVFLQEHCPHLLLDAVFDQHLDEDKLWLLREKCRADWDRLPWTEQRRSWGSHQKHGSDWGFRMIEKFEA